MKSKQPHDGEHQGDGHWGGEGGRRARAGATERDLSFPKTQTRKQAAGAGAHRGMGRLTQWRGPPGLPPQLL